MNWRGVVIHCTESRDKPGVDTAGITAYHKSKGWHDIGYHIVIEDIGDGPWVVAGRSMGVLGAHCRGHNAEYLGFAFVCPMNDTPSLAMTAKAAVFLAGLLDALKLPRTAVFAHRELNDTSCPDAVPMNTLRQMIVDVVRTDGGAGQRTGGLKVGGAIS